MPGCHECERADRASPHSVNISYEISAPVRLRGKHDKVAVAQSTEVTDVSRAACGSNLSARQHYRQYSSASISVMTRRVMTGRMDQPKLDAATGGR